MDVYVHSLFHILWNPSLSKILHLYASQRYSNQSHKFIDLFIN